MSTKGDVVNDAYSKLRISGLTVVPTPELQQKALKRLERFMAFIAGRTICIGYNFTEVPDPSDETGVTDDHFEMMSSNLALKLVPDFNKEPSPALAFQASSELGTTSNIVARQNVRETNYPRRQPIGTGNEQKWGNWRNRYYRPEELPEPGCSTNEIAIDEINDYKESYHAYLTGETISSYVITASDGLTIVSDSDDGEVVSYRIHATGPANGNTFQQVKIVVTTSSGRIDSRLIDFTIHEEKLVGT